MTEEETKAFIEIQETASYYRAYSTSLKKELKAKNVEMGKLLSRVEEFEELEKLKKLVKGDLKDYRKDTYVAELLEQLKKLKKDNHQLICKIGLQHANKG